MGCQNGPSLEIVGVEPRSGWTNTNTPVLILANHVFPAVNIPAGDADGVETNTGLIAQMRPVLSEDVWVDIKQLDIDPDGNVVGVVQRLETGTYDVRLEDVRGHGLFKRV